MNEEKIEKNKRKLFDRLRRLNSMTSKGKLIEFEELFRQKCQSEVKLSADFCLTGLEVTIDRLMEVYNDISDQTNCPLKYVKTKIGRYQK